jgi:Zn-dependent oligopeptidase
VKLAVADAKFDHITEPLTFYHNVSPQKELRDASNAAESLIRNFAVESSMRLDVFNAKVAAEKNIKASGQWEKLSPEEQRLVEKMVNHFCCSVATLNCSLHSNTRSLMAHELALLFLKNSGQS